MTLNRTTSMGLWAGAVAVTICLAADNKSALADHDFNINSGPDPGSNSIVDVTVSQLMSLTDNVSIQWSIYDVNDVLVSTGMYPTDGGTLPVPPGFMYQIQAPTLNPTYTVDIVGIGDKHNHPTVTSGIQLCLPCLIPLPVPPTKMKSGTSPDKAKAGTSPTKVKAGTPPANQYLLVVHPAQPISGTTNFHVPVNVTAVAGAEQVRLTYYAFWFDGQNKRHFLPCFPRNGGSHYVDFGNNLNFSEDVYLQVDNSKVTGHITFGVNANDRSGYNIPYNPQEQSIDIAH